MKLYIGQQMALPALESVRLGKSRTEAAATLTATVLTAPADTYFLKLSMAVGDPVRLLDDGGKEIFLGSIHELEREPEAVALTAYDRGVYLTRNELYGVFSGTGKDIAAKLTAAGYRVETDLRNEKIGYKIREAQMEKVPYMLVLGDKEMEAGQVAVRRRDKGDMGAVSADEFIATVLDDIAKKTVF